MYPRLYHVEYVHLGSVLFRYVDGLFEGGILIT
jgi:hypothetical protein